MSAPGFTAEFLQGLRALFLDMDGTLCDAQRADNAAVAGLAASLVSAGLAEPASGPVARRYLDAIYDRRIEPGWRTAFAVKPDGSERRARLFGRMLADLAPRLDLSLKELLNLERRFLAARVAAYDFYSGVPELLERLKQRYILVLLTNGSTYSQAPKISKTGLRQIVDHVLIAGEAGFEKPDPRLFALACERAGCKPFQALHVGDTLEVDILGAQRAGIRNIWVHHGWPPTPGVARPDHALESILGIEEALGVTLA